MPASDSNPGRALVNFGDLSKPATVLIEKISDAVGGLVKPWQIVRVANAEARAEVIRAQAQIDVTDVQQRGLLRMIREEGRKQENIESITYQAASLLRPDARPEEISNDWLVKFFDKGRLVSDVDIQGLWAAILAREANGPGTFSQKSIETISLMEKKDAQMFTDLCQFVWEFEYPIPLIYDLNSKIYENENIGLSEIHHLESFGLVAFSTISEFAVTDWNVNLSSAYHKKSILIVPPGRGTQFTTGNLLFTNIGRQIYSICNPKRNLLFEQFTIQKWLDMGCTLTSPIPRAGPLPE